MSVLDQLPEGEGVRLIRQIESEQREFKAPQSVGSSAVQILYFANPGPYDITVPANDPRDVLLSYTPSQLAFGGGLVFYAYQSINGGPFYGIEPMHRLRVGSDNIQKWRIQYFNGSNGTALNIRYALMGIGTGTISASLVS